VSAFVPVPSLGASLLAAGGPSKCHWPHGPHTALPVSMYVFPYSLLGFWTGWTSLVAVVFWLLKHARSDHVLALLRSV